jgi:ABC-type nitrate/sulfonate/bicarbonate transport system permease component
MTKARPFTSVGLGLIVPVLALVIWWFASANSTSPYFPPLESILQSFRETWLFAHVSSDVVPSMLRLFGGYLLAVVLGVGLGVALGRNRTLDAACQPIVQFARAVPGVALVPISISLLGIGDLPKILLIAFVCIFPILLNTIDGVRNVESGLEDVGRMFRLSRRERIFAVQVPSAAPQILAGMRIAVALAFILMIVTEMVGATSGIGYVTLNAQQSFQITQMWAGMILLAILGVVLNTAFVLGERRLLRWHYRDSGR